MSAALSSVLFSCGKDDSDEMARFYEGRTVVIYIVGENQLSGNVYNDVEEMLKCNDRLGEDDRVVLYVDDLELPRYYMIDCTTKAKSLNELKPVYAYPKEHNSCSKDVMYSVLNSITRRYPSGSYGLVMWSHGLGWLPSTYKYDWKELETPARKSFGLDNGKNLYNNIGYQTDIEDLAMVLNALPHFEFLMFDACYMQCLEVAYELRHCADHIIASSAEIPAEGAPYDRILPLMFEKQFNPELLLEAYSDNYAGWCGYNTGITLSSISTNELESFAEVTRSMLNNHRDKLDDAKLNGVTRYMNDNIATFDSYNAVTYDIQSLMYHILTTDEYERWMISLDNVLEYSCLAPILVYANYDDVLLDYKHSCGVAMSLDPSGVTTNKRVCTTYRNLEWYY